MSRSRLRVILAVVVLLALGAAGARSLGPLPPLGPLLEPANGVWALARVVDPAGRADLRWAALEAPVEVVVDDRGVPHIFARNEADAWRTLGLLVARDRLFQLELTWRAAGGRLSELLGSRTLEADREARRAGLAWGAERQIARADTAAPGYTAFRAYAEGVNHWIETMPRAALPLEYRLLRARPSPWEPGYSAYLLVRMGFTLSYFDPARARLRAAAVVGDSAADALFPVHGPIHEPIQPNGLGRPRFETKRFPPPGLPSAETGITARRIERMLAAVTGTAPGDGDGVGSNNWVVGPSRSATGRALLAGDPHLELTLPSIWYEAHVVVPDSLDVAGVTLPGAPGIVIGFNRDVAWSFTNTGADVLDFYTETVDDSTSPKRYRVDGVWRPLEVRVETHRGRGGVAIATDTLYFTHRGPLMKEAGAWWSMRWTLFDLTPERGDFLRLGRARSAGDWLTVWKDYEAPAQNGVVADRRGTIAIRSTGKFPIRPGDGRGDVIRDGSSSGSDWLGFLPLEHYPFSLNPGQGFLASANQEPVDPSISSRYLGAQWPSPWRAMRINALLRADSAVTADAMRRYQTDPGSARADRFVPLFLTAAERASGVDDSLRLAARLLAEWDRRYTRENRRAVLFEMAMGELQDRLWDELLPPGAGDSARPVAMPPQAVMAALAGDSSSVWWDDRRTEPVETRDALLAGALRSALRRAVRAHGLPDGDAWRWDRIRHASIRHLLGIPALSALGIPVQAGNGTLSPSSGNGAHGASWRMVVELGDTVTAQAIYPGGQSGHAASRRYRDRIARWSAGELDTVLLPRSPDGVPAARVTARLRLRP
ncbi:MAG: penicillin acylase family protein [Gemmatimonadales bacterium]